MTDVAVARQQHLAAAQSAARRGSLVFHLDLATEVARAAMAADGLEVAELATLVDEYGYRVFGFDAAPLRTAIAEIRFDAAGATVMLPRPANVPRVTEVLLAARRSVAAVDPGRAPASQSIIVLPALASQSQIEAYALALSPDPSTIAVSGHTRFSLGPDGREVQAVWPISASSDADAGRRIPASASVELTIDGDVPLELHTYLSLKHGVSLIVRTLGSDMHWRVDGETMVPAAAN